MLAVAVAFHSWTPQGPLLLSRHSCFESKLETVFCANSDDPLLPPSPPLSQRLHDGCCRDGCPIDDNYRTAAAGDNRPAVADLAGIGAGAVNTDADSLGASVGADTAVGTMPVGAAADSLARPPHSPFHSPLRIAQR